MGNKWYVIQCQFVFYWREVIVLLYYVWWHPQIVLKVPTRALSVILLKCFCTTLQR